MFEGNESGHLCVLCNNKLESKEALKEHFRKHANKEIDGKGRPLGPNGMAVVDQSKPKIRTTYERGSASKFVDGEIACDMCDEKFKCNTAAIQHKFRKHPKSSSKYFCPECGMMFPLKVHRDKHLAAHAPVSVHRTVTCTECSETFFNQRALDYHFRSTHQRLIALFQPVLTPPPSKKIKINNAGDAHSVYYCHLCGFEYIVKFNLQKHLERQHLKEERDNMPPNLIKCTTCEALFYSERGFQNHIMYHKPDDLYVTSEQQRLQVVTRVDQDFDIRRCVLGPEKYFPTQRQKRKTYVTSKEKSKKKEESSDEMSPPSAMDSSSESDSEMPLSNRLLKDKEKVKEKKKVKIKKETQNGNKRKKSKKDLKNAVKPSRKELVKKPVIKNKKSKTKDLPTEKKNPKYQVNLRKKSVDRSASYTC